MFLDFNVIFFFPLSLKKNSKERPTYPELMVSIVRGVDESRLTAGTGEGDDI